MQGASQRTFGETGEPVVKHHIERTSPKGQPFIGTCRLCGMTGLKASAALEDCENVRGLSAEEALIEAIVGGSEKLGSGS